MIREPPWDELDERIKPIVWLLWRDGVETTLSCQGGSCHIERWPTVICYARPEDHDAIFKKVRDALVGNGLSHFFVAKVEQYGLFGEIYNRIVRVEWFGQDWDFSSKHILEGWSRFDEARRSGK